jgi:rhodanese-related sulfurtransferase
VVVLDVRGADAYRAGHIPGAVLVPLETVAGRAAEYAKVAKPIVTYCA